MQPQETADQAWHMRNDAISVIACGSSATIGLPAYLVALSNVTDIRLRVLLTHSAARFIQPDVVAWHADEVFGSADPGLNPAELARQSLGIVVLPATANMLASAALGLAASPAQTALLAAVNPAIFFPCMNAVMWARRSVQGHIAALRDGGHTVIDPLEQPVYELWRREYTTGLALPPPQQAAETIITWLEDALSAGQSCRSGASGGPAALE